MLSEVFWVAFVATTSTMIIKLASLCFKSKCKECIICGGRIKITRDTESEEKEREGRDSPTAWCGRTSGPRRLEAARPAADPLRTAAC